MLTATRWLALVSLAGIILVAGAIVMNEGGLTLWGLPSPAPSLVAQTAQSSVALLSLATGLPALVAAIERRQLRWFTGLLIALVLGAYGPFGVSALVSSLIVPAYDANPALPASVRLTPYIYSAIAGSLVSGIPALTALIYTFRARPIRAAATPQPPPAPQTPAPPMPPTGTP